MTTEAIRTLLFLLLCYVATPGESVTLTKQPSSVNVSVIGVAEFNCTAKENRVSDIFWRNNSSPTLLLNNASLGITVEISGSDSSSERTSMLKIEGQPEYNGTRIQCIASGVTNAAVVTSETSAEAILLVQGPLDAVSSIRFTETDDCCKRVSWIAPYSLAGVPILGYNVTSTDLSINRFVTRSPTLVCSNQVQLNNSALTIQAYNGVDGEIASASVDFNIETRPVVDVGREQLARGGINWTLPITITDLVCSGMENNLDTLAVTIMNEANGLVIVQTEAPVNGMEAVNIPIPDNSMLFLQGSFSLTFENGLSLSSTFSPGRTISTFDFRNVSINYDPENRTCLTCEAITNSRAAACLLYVNSTENATDQLSLTITPSSANIYKTCVDLDSGVYNLTAFDVSSEVGPLTATPALVLTSVVISPTSPVVSATPTQTNDTPSSANPANIIAITGVVALSVVFLAIVIPITMVVIVRRWCLSNETPSNEPSKKLEEKEEGTTQEPASPKESVQKETGQEEAAQDVSPQKQ